MTRYLVKLFKNVIGENGHACEVCQGSFEVSAADTHDAIERGKRAFCDHEQLADWSLHADRVSAVEAEYPS